MTVPVKTHLLNILLADDGSLNARTAAKFLADLPHESECVITALRVYTPLQSSEYWEIAESVDKTMNFLRSRHLHSHAELVLGYPTEKIIEYADSHHPDLIVMGAKGTGALADMLGSVAANIIHDGRWPVLVVREPYTSLRKVLLVTDGSPCSELACNYLGVFPLPEHSEVEVLHVIPQDSVELGYVTDPSGLMVEPMSTEELATARSHAQQKTRLLLDETVRSLALQGVTASSVIAWGEPAQAIENYARENHIDLVICGSRGMGTVTSMFLGSVSRHLINHAPCSVMVVRCSVPQGREIGAGLN